MGLMCHQIWADVHDIQSCQSKSHYHYIFPAVLVAFAKNFPLTYSLDDVSGNTLRPNVNNFHWPVHTVPGKIIKFIGPQYSLLTDS